MAILVEIFDDASALFTTSLPRYVNSSTISSGSCRMLMVVFARLNRLVITLDLALLSMRPSFTDAVDPPLQILRGFWQQHDIVG